MSIDLLPGWCQTSANQSVFAQTRAALGRTELARTAARLALKLSRLVRARSPLKWLWIEE